ncbi:LysE family translocator [Oceanospirillum sediminis]|uniref:LysE family translocator n=1 Tax=Oceanospirillum sediminis TaxID=2760088 RepID=A0A839IMG1_9GAMM|nr:LysE family translocator [Oceanospirillum sediminis]MBB1485702.1 LysE family translocator [Oceanospirillum sediminis]
MADILLQLESYFDASFLTFLAAIILLTISPGVDTVMVIRNTIRGGRIDGLVTSIAICSGLFVHAVVSAAGVSFILLQSASLFTMLKLAGAAYLIWLGWKSLRNAWDRKTNTTLTGVSNTENHSVTPSLRRSFREGFLSNVLNPKTIVFYMAFLPQFIQPHESVMLKSVFLAGVHFIVSNIWQLILILMVAKARQWLSSEKAMRYLDGIIGSVMMTFGIKLATDS